MCGVKNPTAVLMKWLEGQPHDLEAFVKTYAIGPHDVKSVLIEQAVQVGEMIFDEGHRVGGKLKRRSVLKDWPAGLPRRTILLAATPVRRSGGHAACNFNMYKDAGECIFTYNYTQALRDKVCSPAIAQLFSTADGPGPTHDERRLWIYINIARECFSERRGKWNILTYHRAPEIVLHCGCTELLDEFAFACILIECYSGSILFDLHAPDVQSLVVQIYGEKWDDEIDGEDAVKYTYFHSSL